MELFDWEIPIVPKKLLRSSQWRDTGEKIIMCIKLLFKFCFCDWYVKILRGIFITSAVIAVVVVRFNNEFESQRWVMMEWCCWWSEPDVEKVVMSCWNFADDGWIWLVFGTHIFQFQLSSVGSYKKGSSQVYARKR